MNDRNSRRRTREEAGTLPHPWSHHCPAQPIPALSSPGLLWLGAGLRCLGPSLG